MVLVELEYKREIYNRVTKERSYIPERKIKIDLTGERQLYDEQSFIDYYYGEHWENRVTFFNHIDIKALNEYLYRELKKLYPNAPDEEIRDCLYNENHGYHEVLNEINDLYIDMTEPETLKELSSGRFLKGVVERLSELNSYDWTH